MSSADFPKSTAFWYDVCGLRLRSELEIPGLAAAAEESGEDVTVTRGEVEAPGDWSASRIAAWSLPEADVIAWYRRSKLRISNSEITVDSDDVPFARQCVVGPGLGLTLHRRGRVVLHGSAIDVGGRAVVLLGAKGAGKSTTAAALLQRGHTLLTDDLVAVVSGETGTVCCAPGPTQMKLWPASVEAFGLGDEVRPYMEGLQKGVWFGAAAAPSPVPIALICSLEWGDAPRLTRLSGPEAFGAVFDHVYAPRFLDAEAGRSLVAPTAALSQRVRVARLTRPEQLSAIRETLEQIGQAISDPD